MLIEQYFQHYIQVANYSVRNNVKNRFKCCAPYALRNDTSNLLNEKREEKLCKYLYGRWFMYLHMGES